MKKTFIFFTLMLFLFLQTHSKMTEIERTNLLNRLTKKISFDNSNDMESLKNHFFSETLKDTINYDRSKIEEILNKYGLPQNYNFLEEKFPFLSTQYPLISLFLVLLLSKSIFLIL